MAAGTSKLVLRTDARGQFRFSLMACDGEGIPSSEAYPTNAAAVNGTESVHENAGSAGIDDQTRRTQRAPVRDLGA
jgi:uncharacterized protein YegP (UPF0339 family)